MKQTRLVDKAPELKGALLWHLSAHRSFAPHNTLTLHENLP
ncbi:MAG: hypothetical protein ACI835_002874 [Planctomycetota bacterium]|jgi:hypothetical protein